MLTDLLRELAIARANLQDIEDLTTQRRDAYRQTSEFVDYLIADDQLDMIKSTISLLESEVRTEALRAYEQGELPPPPGITIRIYHTVSYNAKAALAWAQERAPALLALDDARFKKAVLNNTFPDAPALVKEEPRATIATNLGAYLPEKEQPTPTGLLASTTSRQPPSA